MPRARLLALEVTDSGKIRIMSLKLPGLSSLELAAVDEVGVTEWALVSPLSPGRPHVLVGCSEGVRCPDLCYPRIAASDFLI